MSTDQWVEKHLKGVSPRNPRENFKQLRIRRENRHGEINMMLHDLRKSKEEGRALCDDSFPLERQVWHLPNFYTKIENRDPVIHRCNKYLENMHKRITQLCIRGEYRKAGIYGEILLRRSNAFQAYSYNKADKGGHWKFSLEKNMEYMKRQFDINRKKLSSLKIIRSYIPKPNGKTRPIGAPVQGDKASLTGITEILKLIVEPQIGNYQHGFMTGRSITQALVKVVDGIQKGNQVFQFDLNSFFNKVNVNLICGRVNSYANGLGRGILNITQNTFPRIKNYHDEVEVERITLEKGVIGRKSGFTQGSPMSPILCNLAMEFAEFKKIKDLIQYADDGVIITKEKTIPKLFDNAKARMTGIEVADKAYGFAMRFKFLGLKFDLGERTITGNDGTSIKYMESSYKKMLEFIKRYGSYSELETQSKNKGGNEWFGKVNPKSLTGLRHQSPEHITKNKVSTFYKDGVKVSIINKGTTLSNGTKNPEGWHEITTVGGRYGYQPIIESTRGARYLLDYYKSLKSYRYQQIPDRDYDKTLGTEGWNAKIKGSKVGVIYPQSGFTYDSENKAIQKATQLLGRLRRKPTS